MQLEYLQWIRFYRMLNELPLTERPDDDVLEDDARCDRWWEDFQRYMTHEATKQARLRARHNGPQFEVPQYQG